MRDEKELYCTAEGVKPITAAGISLVSGTICLQNTLLAEQLQSQLQMECSSICPPQMSFCQCLLFDCTSLAPQEILELLATTKEYDQPPVAALLNATPSSDHESLLNWAGINGIFYLNTDQHQLVMGIRQILKGDLWIPRRLLCSYLLKSRQPPPKLRPEVRLTKRESEILEMVKSGATNAAISKTLNLSEHTIKSHMYNVFRKIGVKNRLEACNWARENFTRI